MAFENRPSSLVLLASFHAAASTFPSSSVLVLGAKRFQIEEEHEGRGRHRERDLSQPQITLFELHTRDRPHAHLHADNFDSVCMVHRMTFSSVSPVLWLRLTGGRVGASLLFAGLISFSAHGALRLPAVISDHAMIQADKPVAVWGWAAPGEEVSIVFDAKNGPTERITAVTAPDGRWSAQLRPRPCVRR